MAIEPIETQAWHPVALNTTDTEPLVVDDFEEDAAAGSVVGSRAVRGELRLGRDLESRLSIDHGALRIANPRVPGPGRHMLTYGPFPCSSGLVFAAYVLNGHNASRTAELDSRHPLRDLARRFSWQGKRVLRDATDAVGLTSPTRRRAAGPLHFAWPPVTDNLALGWFGAHDRRLDPDPLHGFVMRSADSDCGEIAVVCAGRRLSVLHGVQNVPILYLVHLRETGATYYACSLAGVPGLPAYPAMRPLALDPSGDAFHATAGIEQRILGEIGFSVDTRVYGTRVASIASWTAWYGGAHAADRLSGVGPLEHEEAERGGRWSETGASAKRTVEGTVMGDDSRSALDFEVAALDPGEPSGLVHVRIEALSEASRGGLWLHGDGRRALAVVLGSDGARLVEVDGTHWRTLVRDGEASIRPGRRHDLLVMDDGEHLTFALDGRHILQKTPLAQRADATRVGIMTMGAGEVLFSQFEAHPRVVELPPELRRESPWWEPPSTRVRMVDALCGPAGDLHDCERGALPWRRTLGRGVIEFDGDGAARVRASVAQPNPGRTLYTIAWADPELADFEVELTLPGTGRGQGQLGRGGLVLWQDPDHYLVINAWNDDIFPGASVSSFLTWGGAQDLYRAVWTNVGNAIRRGVPHRMRLISDGHHYRVLVDGEPVLQRAVTDIEPSASRLRIHRIGLAVNWEFGDDTGTMFRRFVARGG